MIELPNPSDLIFYLIAAITVLSAAGVAFSRSIVYSALALLGALLGAAGLYLTLSADFVAVTQLLVYVGGVLVLILFAIMLTHRINVRRDTNPHTAAAMGALLFVGLGGLLGWVAWKAPWRLGEVTLGDRPLPGTSAEIGNLLLGHYLLPFEVASLLLLATLLGAVVVARKELKED